MRTLDFDASIDLCGDAPKAAVDRVRQAVETLPGAHWISMEWCGSFPGFEGDMSEIPADRWLRVWPWGTSRATKGPEWDTLRGRIREVVLATLAN